jgi:hypothetical protein
MFGIIKTVLGVVAKPALDFISHKMKMAEARRETELSIELEKQKVISQQATADIKWDQIMAKNSGSSWKDEYWTIVLSIPAVVAFVPGTRQYVMDGFDALMTMPQWYIAALLTAIAAAFGRSELTKWRRK